MSDPLPHRVRGTAPRIPDCLIEQAENTGLTIAELRAFLRAGVARRLAPVTRVPVRPGA